jgi:NTE family protein
MTHKLNRPLVGLALGGGGARALAHIGILKVLERETIPIDFICGTSMGGVIACAYAAGQSTIQMEKIALEFSKLRNLVRLVDVSPHRRGLIEGQRVKELMTRMIGETRTFAELRIPCAVTGVDLISGQAMVFRSGSVADAVMMTSAFPGIFQPVVRDDRLIVDGGILNNVPADVARMLGADVVIAVDVSPRLSGTITEGKMQFDPLLPGIFPSFLSDFYRAEMIMIEGLVAERLKDARPEILLHPPVPNDLAIFLGFPRAAEAINAGMESAEHALPEIKNALRSGFWYHWKKIQQWFQKN